eukprot:1394757-Alexandrium_andersonii.AAC.1
MPQSRPEGPEVGHCRVQVPDRRTARRPVAPPRPRPGRWCHGPQEEPGRHDGVLSSGARHRLNHARTPICEHERHEGSCTGRRLRTTCQVRVWPFARSARAGGAWGGLLRRRALRAR